ncbi:DUF4394 domain-containing protein [Tundrisphaera sp. TA3]|uniref:DUF4394 domain-containing protein n=1 Tax=Tundrisphaera sp. TA3 TaxID=3435775 RepID=UPI003EB6DD9E
MSHTPSSSRRTNRAHRRPFAAKVEGLENRQLLATIIGLTTDSELIRFDSSTPGVVSAPLPISGLQSGESLLGIDFRPATLTLYGLGSTGRLYGVNPTTGVATQVGSGTFSTPLAGTQFGIDFNPTVDRLRVDSNSGQNLRVNPNDGTLIVDGNLAYAAGDSGAGIAPQVASVAYSDSYSGATTTRLYVIDTGRDVLAIQNPANAGTLTTVGPLGADASGPIGFDIVGSFSPEINTAYATATDASGGTALFQINLTTGAATAVGVVGDGTTTVRDIAISQQVETFFSISNGGRSLITTTSYSPTVPVSTTPFTGLQAGESIIGIDVRPANGLVYGLSSLGRLLTIDPLTANLTQVGSGPITPALSGTTFGIDFNPTVDRLRIVSNTGQNLRVNPNDATAIVDGTLAYAAGDPGEGITPQIAEVAYTNSFAGSNATMLYGIDIGRDVLVLQNPANAGTLTTVGSLGRDVTRVIGFDIAATYNVAFAAVTVAGSTTPQLLTINLATGATTLVGPTVGGDAFVGPTAGLPGAALTLPPVLTSIVTYGSGNKPTTIVLNFNKPLDPASAENLANYRIVSFDRRGRRIGTVKLKSATYDAASNTVVLIPTRKSLRLNQPYNLTILGGTSGVTDLASTPISATSVVTGFNRRNIGGSVYPGPTVA